MAVWLRKTTRTVGLVNSSLTLQNASSCAGPHSQDFFMLMSSRRGLETSGMFGLNLLSWLTIPRIAITLGVTKVSPSLELPMSSLGLLRCHSCQQCDQEILSTM